MSKYHLYYILVSFVLVCVLHDYNITTSDIQVKSSHCLVSFIMRCRYGV